MNSESKLPAAAGLITLTAGLLLAQSTTPTALEVVSIRPHDPQLSPITAVSFPPGGRLNATNASLRYLIERVYDLDPFQISGGPSWIKSDRYEIRAEAAGPATETQIKLMAQAMLADRFRLKFHYEMRELAVYALLPTKNGSKLQPVQDKTSMNVGPGIILARGAAMSDLSEVLNNLVDRPVLDKTGLNGRYTFTLRYDQSSVKEGIPEWRQVPGEGQSIFTVLGDIGLKLNPEKDQIKILVIDSADHPSGN